MTWVHWWSFALGPWCGGPTDEPEARMPDETTCPVCRVELQHAADRLHRILAPQRIAAERRARVKHAVQRRVWCDREGGPATWWVVGWTTREERHRLARGRGRWRPNGGRR